MSAPRDDLTRHVPFTRDDTTTDGLSLSGYAAVFGDVTRIDSWEGTFDETIERGAFAKTIRERKPVLQFDHGQNNSIGSIPLGMFTKIREDARGLYVEARLAQNDLVAPVREAIEMGAIDGMSFRFSVVQDDWDESGDLPLRTIREVKLFEAGPVVFPAYTGTTVGVRSDVARVFRDPDSLPKDSISVS